MKEKTSKVVEVRHNFRDYEGRKGHIYVHMIKFENRDFGEYHSQSEECLKFKEGQEATYSIEEKSYRGETEYKVIPIEKKDKANVGGYQRFDERTELCTTVRASSMQAVDLIKSGKAELSEYEALANRLLNWQKTNAKL